MKKLWLFFIGIPIMCSCLDALGQVKVITPHKDLEVNVLRCEVQGEYCVIDMLFENVGPTDIKAQSGSDPNLHKDGFQLFSIETWTATDKNY